MVVRRASFLLPLLVLLTAPGRAAEPPMDSSAFVCEDAQKKPVATARVTSQHYFAEAHALPPTERAAAAQRGLSPYVIRINRDVYYLGLVTQRWLFQRQCARIQDPALHSITEESEAPFNDARERDLDCAAIRATARQTDASMRMLVASIESDLERLPSERWSSVMPGPQRRLNLATCPSYP